MGTESATFRMLILWPATALHGQLGSIRVCDISEPVNPVISFQ